MPKKWLKLKQSRKPHICGIRRLRVNMADFVLKNNYFEFDSCSKQQIHDTALETKFAPPYVCIFMDKVEGAFLESDNTKPWV